MSSPPSGAAVTSSTAPPSAPAAAAPAAPPSRQEIERRLSISLPAPPKPQQSSKPQQPSSPVEASPRPGKGIREALSESEEGEGTDDEDDDGGLDDEDGEMRRKLEEERVVRSGFLDKKGEKRKAWKKRYFVLRTGKLSFYKDQKEYKLLRIVDLGDIRSASLEQRTKYPSAFSIVTAERTFHLKARDKQEAEAWVADVNAARLQEQAAAAADADRIVPSRDVILSESEEGEGTEDEDEEEDNLNDEDGEMRRKLEEERVVRSGFLDKKGEKRKAWKRRYFVLRTGKLSFYKDQKEYKLLRIIDLGDINSACLEQRAKYPSAFGVVTAERTFHLKARDRQEAESWVADINAARRP